MSGPRQFSIWMALGLWAAAVIGGTIYGSLLGFSGPPFVITIGVLAFFLAVQLVFAVGNLGERLGRRAGPQRGVLVAVIPFLAYLIYSLGTNSFAWWRVAMAAAYVLTPTLLVISASKSRPGVWQD